MKKRTLFLTSLTIFTIALAGCGAEKESRNAVRLDGDRPENQMTASAPAGTDTAASGFAITEEEAKAIALSDAGVEEADLLNIRIEKDTDDGISVYDVDFYIQNKEYDYEINAASGDIISRDYEIENDFLDTGSKNTKAPANRTDIISWEDALKIVLGKVSGATEQNVMMELDSDDGHPVYEGEVHYNGTEYEFELNAKTGDILEWSTEREDY